MPYVSLVLAVSTDCTPHVCMKREDIALFPVDEWGERSDMKHLVEG